MKKVVLLGDSIRMGYEKYVKLAFEDRLQIYGPEDCCRFAAYLLRYVGTWKGEMGCGSDVDLVHWNCGLWDCLYLADGEKQTDLDTYGKYLARIHRTICKLYPQAKQSFALSTAVQEHLFTGVFKRFNADIEAYNAVAVETLAPLGVDFDDLYAVTRSLDPACWSDSTHFNTALGTQAVAGAVVEHLEKQLGVPSAGLDYQAAFVAQKKIIGI